MSKLFIDEQVILARPSLMKKVGVVEALILQQLFYLTHGAIQTAKANGITTNLVIEDEGRVWMKLSIAEWLALLQNVVGEKTMRTKLQKLEEAGYIVTRNTGECTRVKEFALAIW